MEAILGLLFLIAIIIFFFMANNVNKMSKYLRNIENQMKGINYKMNLFAKKFDVKDNKEEENN